MENDFKCKTCDYYKEVEYFQGKEIEMYCFNRNRGPADHYNYRCHSDNEKKTA